MRLLVLSNYRAGEIHFEAGQEIDLPEDVAAFVMRDSPGSFVAGDVPTAPILSVDRRQRGGRVRR